MGVERTLSIVKPDAIKKNIIGEIYSRFEKNGLKIIAAKMLFLSRKQAEDFYAVHRGKEFYEPLIEFMLQAPIMVQVLEGENAIEKNREIMGATNFEDAAPGTIRADFASSIRHNAVHGSDSVETAKREIEFFFEESEIFPRSLEKVK
jgi:nucleoside-diphosphate kinase